MTSQIGAALGAITSLIGVFKAAIDARDWAKLGEVSAKLIDQIISAQQAVIDGQVAQADLIGQLAQANEKIRELQAALSSQQMHEPVEVSPGQFALPVKHPLGIQGAGLQSSGKSEQYACQRCFAILGKSVLLRRLPSQWGTDVLGCPECRNEIFL